MPLGFAYNAPIPPDKFQGRADIVTPVCTRLSHVLVQSSCLVGGPMTGRTSLLRFLAADAGAAAYSDLKGLRRVYVSAEAVGTTGSPPAFWATCLRELHRLQLPAAVSPILEEALLQAKNKTIDVYYLEDLFDAFAKNNEPVVLLIDDFDSLFRNDAFWPPNDFFHILRSLGQRNPRGLAFVVGTSRPLLDLWDATRGASPFYNIFFNVPVGRLDEGSAIDRIRQGYQVLGVECTAAEVDLVLAASERHPYLINHVGEVCAKLKQQNILSQGTLAQELAKPDGPVVGLARQILSHLSVTEKQWVDFARNDPARLTTAQRDLLRNLWNYGLIPPGVYIP